MQNHLEIEFSHKWTEIEKLEIVNSSSYGSQVLLVYYSCYYHLCIFSYLFKLAFVSWYNIVLAADIETTWFSLYIYSSS